MSADDLPLKVRIMMALGMAKVKVQEEPKYDSKNYDKQTLPKGFEPSYTRRATRFPIRGIHVVYLIVLIIPILILLPVFDAVTVDEDEPLRDQAKKVADREKKDAWESKTWDNPSTYTRLDELKAEIDVADCTQLGTFFKNEGWTLRAYVAHSILERGC